jgi:GH24 family phage-related lysozyme (muramidase)
MNYRALALIGGGVGILALLWPRRASAAGVPTNPVPQPWRMSGAGRADLRREEGDAGGKLYNDPAGHCTIGVGHLIHYGNCTDATVRAKPNGADFLRGGLPSAGVNKRAASRALSDAEIDALFQQDLRAKAEDWVNANVTVPLNQQQVDALVSLSYNVSVAARKRVTAVLNTGDYVGAARMIKQGPTAGGLSGLIARREAESNLFLS